MSLNSDVLLCYYCMVEYATDKIDHPPRAANTIWNGGAMCWSHFVQTRGFSNHIEVKADDGVFPTAYKIQKKNATVNEASGLKYG